MRRFAALALLSLSAVAAAPAPRAAAAPKDEGAPPVARTSDRPEGEAAAARLAATVAPAVVWVRAVGQGKASFQGQEMSLPEEHLDLLGVVVDPSGLVLAGSPMQMIRAFEASMPGLKISLAIDRPRVRIAGDATEHPAVLVVQDGTLGLAYFQVVAPPEGLVAVDLSKGTSASTGDDLYGARRLPRSFDDAFSVLRSHVAGAVEHPRRAGVLLGDFVEQGLPLFRADGTPAGVCSVQAVGEAGGGLAALRTSMVVGLLPLEDVRASLVAAKAKVPEALERARRAPDPAPDPAPSMD